MLKNPDAAMLNLESLRALSTSTLAWINEFMQRYRVLCVTTHNDSEQMWSGYAENHKGIALRIEGNVDKDSKFQLFKPVTYREKRPSLYDDGLNYLSSSLFADQETSKRAMMDKIIYSKIRQWEHESEYRLAIPLGQGEMTAGRGTDCNPKTGYQGTRGGAVPRSAAVRDQTNLRQ
jgi:hypothetical protein